MSERQAKVDTQVALPSNEEDISVEVLFDAFGSSHRRFVLSKLSQTPTPMQIEDLAFRLAAWEKDIAVADVSPETAEDVEVLLYHVHLPKMADFGLVTYDSAAGTVETGDAFDTAADYLELAEF